MVKRRIGDRAMGERGMGEWGMGKRRNGGMGNGEWGTRNGKRGISKREQSLKREISKTGNL